MSLGDNGLFDTLLSLMREEKAKKRRRGFFTFFALLTVCFAVCFLSFFLFDPARDAGELQTVSTFFSDFLKENEAIAVFLGLN